MPSLIRQDVPTSVEIAISTGKRKSEAFRHVIVSVVNVGQVDAACRFVVAPPAGQTFHPCSLGISQTAHVDWDDFSTGVPGHRGFTVSSLRPGQTIWIELHLQVPEAIETTPVLSQPLAAVKAAGDAVL
ncbi:hypothetical protein [Nitrospirillum amazonense]|uniref:hypothetical protein n=1 Tax=Nitrospirillum amazonense TaxID=28077 RepID=UPI002412A4C0|nr:hypothetical protein [Nitrospirillum amazonense]MDG3444615.1 hypothetical protein [Nitrospirillum amazonense]